IFQANGTPVAADFLINTTTEGDQTSPVVTVLTGGGFVVAYISSDTGDGSNWCLRARVYDATGAAIGNDFIVNSDPRGYQCAPAVTATTDGGFTIAWHTDGNFNFDGSGLAVVSRQFSATGVPATSDLTVNSTTASNQHFASVDTLTNGLMIGVWQSGDS